MLLRYLYLLRSSWPRTLELLYWPTLQMLIWGFMSQFLFSNSSYVFRAFGVLLAAVMLWDVLFRGQLGLSMSFLEEMWARNLGHLFVTPLRPYEWVASLLSMSMIRVLLGILPAALLAIPLYHYSIFAMGLPLVAFFIALLIMGWALGLAICGLILRQGMGAEGLAWTVVFTLSPISCVYYPVSTLPGWLQHAAWAPPSFSSPSIMHAGVARCCRWANKAGLCASALHENREALLLEDRLRRRRGEKIEQPRRARVLAARGESRRIDDRRMGVLGEHADDLDAWIGRRIGCIDDAERRFAT